MVALANVLLEVLRRPAPAALENLQEALLMAGPPSRQREQALEVTGQFHTYLLELEERLTARQYSELASWLDITAVGLVAFEGLLRGQMTGLADLLVGLAAEGTMVVASRQYVKAWEVEVSAAHESATWYVREALWRLSEETQPDLEPAQRLAAVRRALPAPTSDLPSAARAILLGRLFQVLLVFRVGRVLAS